jgi:hypothetical protein
MRDHIDTYLRITAQWFLTPSERRSLLGSPSLKRWIHLLHDPTPDATSGEVACIRAIVRIDAALHIALTRSTRPAQWLRSRQLQRPFEGRTPLAVMFRGPDGLAAVADYLETHR